MRFHVKRRGRSLQILRGSPARARPAQLPGSGVAAVPPGLQFRPDARWGGPCRGQAHMTPVVVTPGAPCPGRVDASPGRRWDKDGPRLWAWGCPRSSTSRSGTGA
jgi:hypothetical protein